MPFWCESRVLILVVRGGLREVQRPLRCLRPLQHEPPRVVHRSDTLSASAKGQLLRQTNHCFLGRINLSFRSDMEHCASCKRASKCTTGSAKKLAVAWLRPKKTYRKQLRFNLSKCINSPKLQFLKRVILPAIATRYFLKPNQAEMVRSSELRW